MPELSSNTLPSRAAVQTSLHKMYTFVYRTFIKFILFCRGLLPGTGTRCCQYVSMPSRAYISFLHSNWGMTKEGTPWCQCPLGLISHFYVMSVVYDAERHMISVNALSGLYLISTVPLQKPRFYAVSRACFCRYLSEYSDNNRFSCMLTFWTYLMRFTYP